MPSTGQVYRHRAPPARHREDRPGRDVCRPSGEYLTACKDNRVAGRPCRATFMTGETTARRPMRRLAVGPCGSRRLLSGRLRGGSRSGRLGLGLRRRAALLHIDAAPEMRAFGNRHARGRDVAVHRPVVADVDFFGGADVARHFPEDDHGFGKNLGLDACVRTDREHVLTQLDLAFDLAFNREIFAAVELALDDDRFAYVHNSSLLSTLSVAGWRRTRRWLRG